MRHDMWFDESLCGSACFGVVAEMKFPRNYTGSSLIAICKGSRRKDSKQEIHHKEMGVKCVKEEGTK